MALLSLPPPATKLHLAVSRRAAYPGELRAGLHVSRLMPLRTSQMLPVAGRWPARIVQRQVPHSSLRSPSDTPLLCWSDNAAIPAPSRSGTAATLARRPDRLAGLPGATVRGHTPHWRALHGDRPGFPVGTAPQA